MNKTSATNALGSVAETPRFFRCSERSQAVYAEAIRLWRWPIDIREASPYLFRRKRTLFREFLQSEERRYDAPLPSEFEVMQRMFTKWGPPATKVWSDGPFDGLPMEAFFIAFAFYHHQFAEERLRSASYFFGTGFPELTDELLDAAELNLDEAEQMLERLPAIVQLTANSAELVKSNPQPGRK